MGEGGQGCKRGSKRSNRIAESWKSGTLSNAPSPKNNPSDLEKAREVLPLWSKALNRSFLLYTTLGCDNLLLVH